jgi:hypothetical protein
MKSYITDALILLGSIALLGMPFSSAAFFSDPSHLDQLFRHKAVQSKEAAPSTCCQISETEKLTLELGIERAERRQDEVNRFYQDNVLAPAAKICAAHGWDCPQKIVFDPRSVTFNPKPAEKK